MKKVFSILTVSALITFGGLNAVYAQDAEQAEVETTEMAEEVDTNASAETETAPVTTPDEDGKEEAKERLTFHQIIKQKFIEGGPEFMGIVLLVLILGLAICIERIIYLNMASTNNTKLLLNVKSALNNGGVEKAKEVCRNTRGPVASIFFQGLDRVEGGIDVVEKSIISYGSVMMGQLERGVSWISLFIALAPMLGFMGTVIGMIGAFDAIEAAGDISPSLVAGGIKVALLTTVFGLIVAIILQIFYNYIVAKIDNITNSMENASIGLIDLLVEHQAAQPEQ
ncbi:MAG: MotA/TolQ/ExbB proton channel family protein [Cryomorphaceae bacterium]|nr:MotA/TolQ/ExbB proton channel family protein [Cryomorphaceae bacterium]